MLVLISTENENRKKASQELSTKLKCYTRETPASTCRSTKMMIAFMKAITVNEKFVP